MLEGKNLLKSVGSQKIVDNVNLQLEPGEISVVIGPSGSGKTTLLKLMSLLEAPDSGTVTVDGEKTDSPWPKVTVVFQQLFLWPHLTLEQNIRLPLALRSGVYKGDERRSITQSHPEGERRVDDFLELFDMKGFVGRYPNQASLGQRQRAALVRALVLQPKYILLDEITSSLDVEQIAIILSYLQRLAKRGIGIMLVTHLLNFARQAADKVIFVDAGQVIESGGKEVLNSPQNERVKKFLSVIESAS